jgi:hypothetical protein
VDTGVYKAVAAAAGGGGCASSASVSAERLFTPAHQHFSGIHLDQQYPFGRPAAAEMADARCKVVVRRLPPSLQVWRAADRRSALLHLVEQV